MLRRQTSAGTALGPQTDDSATHRRTGPASSALRGTSCGPQCVGRRGYTGKPACFDWCPPCHRPPRKAPSTLWEWREIPGSWMTKCNTAKSKKSPQIDLIFQCDSSQNLSRSFQGILYFNSVQFSHSVVSDSLRPHGLQHARPPCPSPTPWVYPNSCPLSQWRHPTISSSVIPFSSYLQSFPASVFFQIVSSSHQVAKVLEFQLQHQSFQWTFRTDFL